MKKLSWLIICVPEYVISVKLYTSPCWQVTRMGSNWQWWTSLTRSFGGTKSFLWLPSKCSSSWRATAFLSSPSSCWSREPNLFRPLFSPSSVTWKAEQYQMNCGKKKRSIFPKSREIRASIIKKPLGKDGQGCPPGSGKYLLCSADWVPIESCSTGIWVRQQYPPVFSRLTSCRFLWKDIGYWAWKNMMRYYNSLLVERTILICEDGWGFGREISRADSR